MKTLLVPIDFSKSTKSVLNYTIAIAKCNSSKIILFHSYQLPILRKQGSMLSKNEIETQIVNNLKQAAEYIKLNNNENLIVECMPSYGNPVNEIKLCAKKNKVDLIIMGLLKSDSLEDNIIEDVSTTLINELKCPVIIINENVVFRDVKNIVLAFDYKEIKNKYSLSILNKFISLFKSHVFIFNIVKPQLECISSVSKVLNGTNLVHELKDAAHSFHYSENEDVVEGINNFVINKEVDMVVMIPHKHSPLYNLYNESQTKKMILHTPVPLLILSE